MVQQQQPPHIIRAYQGAREEIQQNEGKQMPSKIHSRCSVLVVHGLT